MQTIVPKVDGCASYLVGNKEKCFTHRNGTKRFSFQVLPKPALAKDGKSRGTATMKEALITCISHDAWKASRAAVRCFGLQVCSANQTTQLDGVIAPLASTPMILSLNSPTSRKSGRDMGN